MREIDEKAEEIWAKEKMDETFKVIGNMYHGKWQAKGNVDDKTIHVNMLYPVAKLASAGLSVKNPRVTAQLRSDKGDLAENESGNRMAAVLNYQTEMLDYAQEIALARLHAQTLPFGVIKYGLDDGGLVWWAVVNPRDLRIDPGLTTFRPSQGRWIRERFQASLAALRETGLYDVKVLDAIRGRHAGKGKGELVAEETIMLECKEYYRKVGDRIELLTEAVDEGDEMDDPLRYEPNWDDHGNGFPYEFLWLSDPLRGLFPIAEPMLYREQNLEINGLRTKGLNAASRANIKIVATGTNVDQDELNKLKSDEAMEVTQFGDGTKVDVLNPAALNTDVYRVQEQQARDDIANITGFMGDSRELPQTGSRPANIAMINQKNSMARMGEVDARTQRWLLRLYRKTANLNQAKLSKDLWIKIAGKYAKVGKKDIAGDYDYSLNIYNNLSSDPAQRRADAEALFKLLAGVQDENGVKIATRHLVNIVLDAWDRTDGEQFWAVPAKEEKAPAVAPAAPPNPLELASLAGGAPPPGLAAGLPPPPAMPAGGPPGMPPLPPGVTVGEDGIPVGPDGQPIPPEVLAELVKAMMAQGGGAPPAPAA